MLTELAADRALIFRIIHKANLPWVFRHGMHCRSSNTYDPSYVNIGNPDLIEKRRVWTVEHPPGGTLSDYVPFYFTPLSPMLLNIKTGYNGIIKRPNTDIAILVSSLPHLRGRGIPFLFTDRHAYLRAAVFSDDLADLGKIDWGILQNRDFKRDQDDLGKVERYQAEALVHRQITMPDLLGIACVDAMTRDEVAAMAADANVDIQVITKGGWYF